MIFAIFSCVSSFSLIYTVPHHYIFPLLLSDLLQIILINSIIDLSYTYQADEISLPQMDIFKQKK